MVSGPESSGPCLGPLLLFFYLLWVICCLSQGSMCCVFSGEIWKEEAAFGRLEERDKSIGQMETPSYPTRNESALCWAPAYTHINPTTKTLKKTDVYLQKWEVRLYLNAITLNFKRYANQKWQEIISLWPWRGYVSSYSNNPGKWQGVTEPAATQRQNCEKRPQVLAIKINLPGKSMKRNLSVKDTSQDSSGVLEEKRMHE